MENVMHRTEVRFFREFDNRRWKAVRVAVNEY
jgi:hypothetical protein